MARKIFAKVTNTKPLPYNLTSDEILIKVVLLDSIGNPSYAEGVIINLYSNVTGVDALIGSYTTNVFGVCTITYTTDLIEDKENKGRRIVQARFYAIDYDPNGGYNHNT